MSDEIKQKLGIDAADALTTLKQLDSGYLSFQNRIASVATALDQHNKMAGKTVAAHREIVSSANAAAKALEKINKAQSGAGSSGSPRGSSRSSKQLTGQDASDAFDKLLGKPTQQAVKTQLDAERQLLDSVRRVGQGTKSNLGDAEQATKSWT